MNHAKQLIQETLRLNGLRNNEFESYQNIEKLCKMLELALDSLDLMSGPQEFDCLVGDKSKQVVSQMTLEKIEIIAKGGVDE